MLFPSKNSRLPDIHLYNLNLYYYKSKFIFIHLCVIVNINFYIVCIFYYLYYLCHFILIYYLIIFILVYVFSHYSHFFVIRSSREYKFHIMSFVLKYKLSTLVYKQLDNGRIISGNMLYNQNAKMYKHLSFNAISFIVVNYFNA